MIHCTEARLPHWLAVEHGEVIANPANLLNASTLVRLEVDWRSPLSVADYGQTGRRQLSTVVIHCCNQAWLLKNSTFQELGKSWG